MLVTSTFHGHVAEVEVGPEEGLARTSAVNCDNLFTLPRRVLTRRIGRLGPGKLAELDRALMVVLGLPSTLGDSGKYHHRKPQESSRKRTPYLSGSTRAVRSGLGEQPVEIDLLELQH